MVNANPTKRTLRGRLGRLASLGHQFTLMHQAYAADLLVQVGSLANADFISMTGRSNDLIAIFTC